MATRIIKQGTARASVVKQFSFPQNASLAAQKMERPEWMPIPSMPTSLPENAPAVSEKEEPLTDAAAAEQAAYEKGLVQGEKAAAELAEHKLDSVLKRYADSIGEIQKLRTSLYAQVEREVVRLALAVAKKIVHREVRVDREIRPAK